MILLAMVKRGLLSVVLIRPMMKSAKPAPKVVRAKPVTFWLALSEVVRKEKRSPDRPAKIATKMRTKSIKKRYETRVPKEKAISSTLIGRTW